MKRTRFTARDVHRAYPWIPGTTLFNRIKSGIIPVETASAGPGEPYQFSLEGMVHIGVIDELHSLGVWKSGISGTDLEIDFSPAPRLENDFESAVATVTNDHLKALIFYRIHTYRCQLVISIKHRRYPGKHSLRHKRSTRTFYIAFAADPAAYAGALTIAPLTQGTDKHGAFIVLTNAVIDVNRISYLVHSALTV